MIIFRCTQKFAKKFNFKLEKNIFEESTNVLGDWYFNYFTYQRKFYLLGISEKSLLPIVIPAKEIGNFTERFCQQLKEMLQILGIDQAKIENELSEMSQIRFGTTRSKIVLGCQNDFIRIVLLILHDDPPQSLLEHSLKLSRMPFKSIGYASPLEIAISRFQKTDE